MCHTIHLVDGRHKLSVEKENIEWKRLSPDSIEIKNNWNRLDICDDCYKSFFNCLDTLKIGKDVLKRYGQNIPVEVTQEQVKENMVKNSSDDELYSPKKTSEPKKESTRPKRKIKCNEDGMIFDNVRQAAEHYNISDWSIYQSLNRGARYKGLTFSRVSELDALFNGKEIRVGDVV